MTQPNLLELAKQGDATAIASLLNRQLQPQGITVKAALKNSCLQVILESDRVSEQQAVVPSIRSELIGLGSQAFKKVKISGRETGDEFPDWHQEFEIEAQLTSSCLKPETESEEQASTATQKPPQPSRFWGSITKMVADAGGAIAETASQAGKNVVGKATEVGGTISDVASQAGKNVVGKATEVGGAISEVASQTGKNVVGKITDAGGAIADTASHASQAVFKKATDTVAPIVNSTVKTIENAKKASTDWLIRIIDKVDVVKAEAEVRQLEQQYPNEKPNQIAHRLMVHKALIAGGTGLASNLLPGAALTMIGVDLAATTALSAELIYQIAAAYGLDLQSSDRKGEVLTIFSLSLGGNLAIDAGLGFLAKVPLAGAAIGASSNAAMMYALGYGACRFYEAKLNALSVEATLEASQAESQKYLAFAIAQEAIMDQILVHVFLAGNPGKTGSEILPELQSLNLSPASMEAIAANINSPPSLESLLAQLNSDFAVTLLAQCQKIAELDGIVTPEESQAIETILYKFNMI